jgi:flagellar biosynthetic protein FlhB
MNAPDRDRRTIDPTPQRIAEFRKRGETARSQDLGAATTSVAGAVVGLSFYASSQAQIVDYFRSILGSLDRSIEPTLAFESASVLLGACLPVTAGALAGYLASTTLQIGAPPVFGKIEVKFERIVQLGGLKQMLDFRDAAWRVLKALLKLTVVGLAAFTALSSDIDAIGGSMHLTAASIAEQLAGSIERLVFSAGIALVVLGVFDLVIAKRRLLERMRMTPEELKKEMKDQEGDPEIRRRRKQRMRELARRRIAVEVPKADVVILNPTHYAVAVRYRAEEGGAPRVVAKGKDAIAARIRELAREHGIPMLRKPSLARLLFKTVREGSEIPPNLYRAVAEVLAYIYRATKRSSR